MDNKEEYIEEILSQLRNDLREETKQFLEICSNKEISNLYGYKNTNGMGLEIEFLMMKYQIFGVINSENFPSWKILDNNFYEIAKKRFLPKVRERKINDLLN